MMEVALGVLPGLYAAALAGALLYVMNRWFDRLPGHVVALHASLIAIVLGPHLFLDRTLVPTSNLRGSSVFASVEDTSADENPLHDDLLVQLLPTMRAVRASIAGGELPFRDDSTGVGVPLWADQQAQILQPTAVLALPFDAPQAMNVQASLRLFLALTFSYLFFARDSSDDNAGLIGSLVFGLGGFVQLWLGWPIATTAAWLPASLYAIDRAYFEGRRRDRLLLVVVSFGLLTSGHPETIAYAVGFGALFFVWRISFEYRKVRLASVRQVVIPFFVGALLSAPMNVPALHAIDESARSLILEYEAEIREQRGEKPSTHYGRIVSLFAPETYGNSQFGTYAGESNINEDGSGYTGAASILLLCLLPFVRGRMRLLWLSLISVTACILIMAAPPPFGWIVWEIPVLSSSSSGGHRLLLIVYFLFAWLSAECVRRLKECAASVVVVTAVAICLIALLVATYHVTAQPDVEGLDETRRQYALLAQVIAIAIAAFALTRANRLASTTLLAVAIVAELLFAHLPANPPGRLNLPPPPPALEYLQAHGTDWRVDASIQSLRPNVGSLYGVRTADAYNPVQPWQWFAMMVGYSDAATDEVRGAAPAWRDALGIRYILRSNAGSSGGSDRVFSDERNVVIERTSALPFVRFASSVARPDADTLPAMLMQGTDVAKKRVAARAASLITDKGSGVDIATWLLSNAPPSRGAWVDDTGFWTKDWHPTVDDRVAVLEWSNNRVRLETIAAGPRLVVTTLIDDGGWSVSANGRPFGVTRVNGPFVGIEVPARRAEIELRYRPPGLVVGIVLGLVGLLLAPVIVMPRRARTP